MDLSQRALFFILFCVIYGIASTSYGVDCNAAVDIQQGTLQGQAEQRKGFEACSYKGIPYAKAPVGELRWRAPQAANSFEGVYQAKQFGPECYQNITSSRLQGESFSERISRCNSGSFGGPFCYQVFLNPLGLCGARKGRVSVACLPRHHSQAPQPPRGLSGLAVL